MASFSKSMAAGLLVLGGALLSGSCVDNNSSFFVFGVMDISRSQCVAQPDNPVFLASGTLDRHFANGYEAAILVGSHLTQRGSREKLRTETARITVTGAHVTLFGTNHQTIDFDSAATGLVNPASGTDPGVASVFTRLVRKEDESQLGDDGQIIARVRILGTTLGGEDVETGPFDYPITLCTGCLVTFPADVLAPDGSCNAVDNNAPDVNVCFFGQDSAFPCTACAASDPVCANPSAPVP